MSKKVTLEKLPQWLFWPFEDGYVTILETQVKDSLKTADSLVLSCHMKSTKKTALKAKMSTLPEALIKSAIANKLNINEDDFTILSVEESAGSSPGDNFICQIKAVLVRVKVKNGETREEHFMVKINPNRDSPTGRIILEVTFEYSFCFAKIF